MISEALFSKLGRPPTATSIDPMSDTSLRSTVNDHRIIIVSPNLGGGGAERLHVNLANDWASQGFCVEFVLLRKEGLEGELIPSLAPEIAVTGLNVRRIKDAILPLAAHLRKSRPMAVLAAMWPLTSAAVFAWLLSGRKCRLFLSEHENLTLSYIEQGRAKASYLRTTIRLTYPLATGVVAVSGGVKDDLCSLGRLPSDSVRVIHNAAATGVGSGRESPQVRAQLWGSGFDNHVLTVGRLSPEKDQATLIKAFALLPSSLNAKLVILGQGPLKGELEALVAKLGLDGRVSLPGFLPDPYPWFRSADLFVLSSLREGFGNVLVEALECGVPVVSTNCPGGPSEILEDGRYGKLVPMQDSVALAAAMAQSLSTPHDRPELMRRAADFSVRKIANEYLAYFLPGSATVPTSRA